MTETNAPKLALTAHESYLSDAEVDALIRVAQDVPFNEELDSWGTTPEADDAMERLTRAFLPLIHKVARISTVLDPEDALMTCLEEFVSVVRRYEVGSSLPFKAGLRTILTRKIGDVGRTSSLIVVKENVAATYRRIMDKHDWDLEAAYQECMDTANGIAPETFLAAHRALSVGVDSLDAPADLDDSSTGRHESFLADPEPTPEAQTVQAETIRYLFQQVPAEQEGILRLAYGFADLATENARLAAGFRADGSPLSDREVAQVLGMRTPTVNRHRNAALSTMRDALTEDEDEPAQTA